MSTSEVRGWESELTRSRGRTNELKYQNNKSSKSSRRLRESETGTWPDAGLGLNQEKSEVFMP